MGAPDVTWTPQELMAIATGRELRDGETAIFGVGLSMLAGFFAIAHHAPRLKAITEGGVFGATPVDGLPWGIECTRISANATSFSNALDALGCFVAAGRCDVGIIGAAQVDRFGNVNTTGIWDGPPGKPIPPPRTRLSGSGGANDIATGCGRVVIMAAHERKRFVERVDYISSPGHLTGGSARQDLGLRGNGPSAIVTTLGVLRPAGHDREFELSEWFPGTTPEAVRAATGWDLRVAADAHETIPPSAAELAALRHVDQTGMLRRKSS